MKSKTLTHTDICKSMSETRICRKCGEQPISEFYCHKDKKQGVRYRCKKCACRKVTSYGKKNKQKLIQKYRNYRVATRYMVLIHYSKSDEPFCECCSEKAYQFLVIDHKFGGGNQHKKEIGADLYGWIIKNKYPDIFRVLCQNCNSSYGIYGYCPHQGIPDGAPGGKPKI